MIYVPVYYLYSRAVILAILRSMYGTIFERQCLRVIITCTQHFNLKRCKLLASCVVKLSLVLTFSKNTIRQSCTMAPLLIASSVGRLGLDTICRRSAQLHHISSVAIKATAASASSTTTIYNNANINNLTHLHHNCSNDAFNKQQTASRYLSSTPSSTSQPGNITTDLTMGDEERNKSIFSKLWDKYSFEGQKKRIVLGERLFRAAQYRASDP